MKFYRRWACALLLAAGAGTVTVTTDARNAHAVTRAVAKRATRTAAKPAAVRKPVRHPRNAVAAKRTHRTTRKTVFLERRVPAVKAGLPNVQAQGALVLDENGHELYARNPDHARPIASISKLAATLAVMDKGLELEGLSTITKADIDAARGGARSRLLEGMTLSNRDLLHAALMGSDNRAIPALGRAVKLTPSQLATAMTGKAKDLGLKSTRFHDPTGLSMENVSTPRETIALLRAVMRHPVLGPITQRVQYDAHPIGRPPISYTNTYRPAVRNNVHVLGGKTGYNDDARYCLVLAAKVDGHTCYMSFLANEGKLTRFGDVARVADWIVSRKPKGQTTVLAQTTTTAKTNSKTNGKTTTTATTTTATTATATALSPALAGTSAQPTVTTTTTTTTVSAAAVDAGVR
ncbi:MAG: D-alanyl-D-alanine carboxypeptidase [Deltaproteobacteria bacterium]|nr:D-alanyl-D-alanine carboxypeptidase [Deltaproteobacteria bacterium]